MRIEKSRWQWWMDDLSGKTMQFLHTGSHWNSGFLRLKDDYWTFAYLLDGEIDYNAKLQTLHASWPVLNMRADG